MSTKQTLNDWLNEALTAKDKGKPRMVSVCHMTLSGEHKEIDSHVLTGALSTKDLAQWARRKADGYCQELSGIQHCFLFVFFDEDTEPKLSHPFISQGALSFGENGLQSEGPTDKGLVQQAMRHMEALMQASFGVMGKALDQSFKQAEFAMQQSEYLAKQNKELREENADAFDVVREMVTKASDTTQAKAMAQLEHKRQTEERKKWLSFAPALINTIAGREVVPVGMADTALVETIADSISEEEMMKIGGVLKPEIMGPLLSRFTDIMAKKAKLKEQEKEAAELAGPDDYIPTDEPGTALVKTH
jgi:hypothetical protein